MRPRLLLLPEFTELEWAIRPLLEEWADVISFDPPGIGGEPLPEGISTIDDWTREAVVERGLQKLGEADWGRFFVVAEGWGIASAVDIAARRRDDVAGMSLGHAKLSYSREGERAPISAAVYDTFAQLVRQDTPSFIRYGIAQLTRGGIDEDRAERIVERLPAENMIAGWDALTADEPFREKLLGLDVPLLLAKHEGCLLSTDEGFEDAVAALPEAETAVFDDPPASSPEFAAVLRSFCGTHWA